MHKNKSAISWVIAVSLVLILTAGIASAATETYKISYSGKLTSAAGTALTGTYNVTFRLYNSKSGGSAIATDAHNVTASGGQFTTTLTFPASNYNGQQLFVSLQRSPDPEKPRTVIYPVPYALGLRPGAVILGDVTTNPSMKVINTGANVAALIAGTTGTNSPALFANAQGINSPAVYALSSSDIGVYGKGKTGGYFSTNQAGTGNAEYPGVNISTAHDYNPGIVVDTKGRYSDGVWVETAGQFSEGVGVHATGKYSDGVWVDTSGEDGDGLIVHTTGDDSEGIYAYTSGPGSDGAWVETKASDSYGARIFTSGDESVGVYANTMGTDSHGVMAYTSGQSSNGVNVTTSGDYSDGVIASTSGLGSYGMSAITSGDYSKGVNVSTSGDYSPGMRASTSGRDSDGMNVFTAGDSSDGVIARTSGPDSVGVNGISVQSIGVQGNAINAAGVHGNSSNKAGVWGVSVNDVGVYADTLRTDHMYGIMTRDYMSAARYDTNAGDVAEYMQVSGDAGPGTVLVIGKGGVLSPSSTAYDTRVAGIVSTTPGVALGTREGGNPGEQIIAVAGRVPCRVDASNGAIQEGDLLTTSSRPGYAMKAEPIEVSGRTFYPSGTVLGKAMGTLESGTGTIDVLVTLQ
jgi:hypothetical protein